MYCNCIVQILIENDVSSAVGPAAYVHSHADGGRMSGGILNMYAHYGVFSAHALGSVDSVLQKLLHGGGPLIFIVASKGTHQGLLGQEGRGLNGGSHADAY